MAPSETSLPPKVRKSWQNPGIESIPSADDNFDPTEYRWCPEVLEIMAKYGQTPADMIVSDVDSEDGIDSDIKDSDSDGEQFPTHDTA